MMSLRAFVAKQSPVKWDHLIDQHLLFKRRLLPRATPSSQLPTNASLSLLLWNAAFQDHNL